MTGMGMDFFIVLAMTGRSGIIRQAQNDKD